MREASRPKRRCLQNYLYKRFATARISRKQQPFNVTSWRGAFFEASPLFFVHYRFANREEHEPRLATCEVHEVLDESFFQIFKTDRFKKPGMGTYWEV